jgi:hypothetical protein
MDNWDDYTHKAALAGAFCLANFSTELRDRLSGQGNELTHDDTDYFLRQIIGMAESMRVTVAAGKREGAAWLPREP